MIAVGCLNLERTCIPRLKSSSKNGQVRGAQEGRGKGTAKGFEDTWGGNLHRPFFLFVFSLWPTFLVSFPSLLGMDIWFGFCFTCNIMKDMKRFVNFFEEWLGSGSHSYSARVNWLSHCTPNKSRISFNYNFKTSLAKTWRMQYHTAGHLLRVLLNRNDCILKCSVMSVSNWFVWCSKHH